MWRTHSPIHSFLPPPLQLLPHSLAWERAIAIEPVGLGGRGWMSFGLLSWAIKAWCHWLQLVRADRFRLWCSVCVCFNGIATPAPVFGPIHLLPFMKALRLALQVFVVACLFCYGALSAFLQNDTPSPPSCFVSVSFLREEDRPPCSSTVDLQYFSILLEVIYKKPSSPISSFLPMSAFPLILCALSWLIFSQISNDYISC